MEYYEPLTPELRQGINETIEKELGKLNTCKPTAFVAARRIGLRTTKNVYLIRAGEKKSINGYIDEDSEFIQLQAGTNTLQYEAKSGKENLDVTVEYKQKYLGV